MDETVRSEPRASAPGTCSALAGVLLRGKKEHDRIAAAEALGEIGSDEAAKALVAYFRDTYSGALNEAAASALAKCGEPGLDALIDLHRDVKMRSLCEQVLRTIDDPRAVQALEDVGRQREQYLATGAASYLFGDYERLSSEQVAAVEAGESPDGSPWDRLIAWAVAFVAGMVVWALPLSRLGSSEGVVKYFVAFAVIIIVRWLMGRLLGLPKGWRLWVPARSKRP